LDGNGGCPRSSLCGDEHDGPFTGQRERLVPVLDPAGFGEQTGVVGAECDHDDVTERSGIGPQTQQLEP
jgi:hypothetical protein